MAEFYSEGQILYWRHRHQQMRIEPWGPNSLRIRATENAHIDTEHPGALLSIETKTSVTIKIGSNEAVIQNENIKAILEINGRTRFIKVDSEQELLAEEPPFFSEPVREFVPVGGSLFKVSVPFQAYEDEQFFGLGQHPTGRMNQKGMVVDLVQKNGHISIPFVLSSRGYGFLWNNPAMGRVELSTNQTRWIAEETAQIDYWITTDDSPADIVSRYVSVTGLPPRFPQWASGFWQSKLRYKTQEELLTVAREYHQRDIPLSVIVIDFFHWPLMGDFCFKPSEWPDPKGMIRELGEMGIKTIVSVWPSINRASDTFEEMEQKGYLIRTERGQPAHQIFIDRYPDGPVYIHYYDATFPDARKYFWSRLKNTYYQQGITAFWLDACEPEMFPGHHHNLIYHQGTGLQVGTLYPQQHAKGVYEGLKAEGETEILSLCRSAWAGSQHWGAAVWSGDILSTFESLSQQVKAGLNMAVSGIPWWTTDIGGFIGGDPTDETFRELLVRWFQFGVFCPICRLHGNRVPEIEGSGAPNEIWSFGDTVYPILKTYIDIRERLRPYIHHHMDRATQTGLPVMRPCFFDFPEDHTCWNLEDQYMFGPDLLVAPVTEHGLRERSLYLPTGAEWKDAWTEERVPGGQWITRRTPLDVIPIYLKNNAKSIITQFEK
jgi:alpha-D-xyloside xylohydrolase